MTSHRRVARLSWVVVGAIGLASPAGATAPGNIEGRLIDNARFVCTNDPANTCVPKASGGREAPPDFTFELEDATDCPAPGPGEDPAECRMEFVPGAAIRAELTLIADADTPDGLPDFDENNQPSGNDDNLAVTYVLEFSVNKTPFVLTQSFYGDDFGFVKIGGWNEAQGEILVFEIAEVLGMVPVDGLAPLNQRLREIALAEFGEAGIPVITDFPRKTPEREIQDTVGAEDAGTPLGSVARYRLEIRFAREQ